MKREPVTVVIPTAGRDSLRATLDALPPALPVIVVDDRADGSSDLPLGSRADVQVVRAGGHGPAAARNAGWRVATTPWIAFLDDDVIPEPDWHEALNRDLSGLPDAVAGSQGRITVPLPPGPLTDAERNTAGLASAEWITADMAYRRAALRRVDGFDERFPRAYREDADLALRLRDAGYQLVKGTRRTVHPVRDDGFWASLARQRGNADDALMRRVHGPGWRLLIGAQGRLRRHALTVAFGAAAIGLAALPGRRAQAAAAALGWALLTAEFAWARIAPGSRTAAEVTRMVVTSALIPPAACFHRLRGELGCQLGSVRNVTTGESARASASD